jgi:hypothetical protein
MEDKKIRFRVASMPNADPFQLHIYAALAEQEREFISKRTKAALAAAKARGVKLGGDRGSLTARNDAKIAKADAFAHRAGEMVLTLKSQGLSNTAIAQKMESFGLPRPQGGKWTGDVCQPPSEEDRGMSDFMHSWIMGGEWKLLLPIVVLVVGYIVFHAVFSGDDL